MMKLFFNLVGPIRPLSAGPAYQKIKCPSPKCLFSEFIIEFIISLNILNPRPDLVPWLENFLISLGVEGPIAALVGSARLSFFRDGFSLRTLPTTQNFVMAPFRG